MTDRSIRAFTAVSLVFGLLLVGCETTQSVVDIRQHPTKDVTVVHTVERGGWNPEGDRFWHCVQEGQQLLCEPVCGDDVECPPAPGIIRADASAEARLGDAPTPHDPVAADPAESDDAEAESDEVEVHTTTHDADDEATPDDSDVDGEDQ